MYDPYEIYMQVYKNVFKLLGEKYFVNVCKLNKNYIIKMVNNNYSIKEAHAVCITIHLILLLYN